MKNFDFVLNSKLLSLPLFLCSLSVVVGCRNDDSANSSNVAATISKQEQGAMAIDAAINSIGFEVHKDARNFLKESLEKDGRLSEANLIETLVAIKEFKRTEAKASSADGGMALVEKHGFGSV